MPFKAIAEIIGRRLNLPLVSLTPEQAAEHVGFLERFAAIDRPASSAKTRTELDWQPDQLGLLADLDQPYYFAD